jgi:hypothetical protein
MRIDSTGRVGLGTNSPDVKLDIVDTAADVQLRVYKFDGTNNTRLTLTADDSGAKIHYRDATNGGALRFNNNAGEMARFDSSGNLLVGTTTYNSANQGILLGATGAIYSTNTSGISGSFGRNTTDGSILNFRKDNVNVGSVGTKLSDGGTSDGELFITSGNTGLFFDDIGSYIRPCNGSAALRDNTVDLGKSDSRFKNLYLSGNVTSSGTFRGGAGSASTPTFLTDGSTGMFRASSNDIGFSCAGSEVARFDSSGNLLVGTTSTTADEGGLVLIPQTSNVSHMYIGHATGTAGGNPYMYFRYGSGNIGSITQSGTTAVQYNTSSDQRLKENIADAPSASDDIDAIQVRSFDWKADGSHQKYGMVAQELQNVAPEAVSGDADSDDMMGVDYSKLVPMLVKEIQSLRARVAQLETN